MQIIFCCMCKNEPETLVLQVFRLRNHLESSQKPHPEKMSQNFHSDKLVYFVKSIDSIIAKMIKYSKYS